MLTHGHFDHYGSAAAIRKATGASIAVYFSDFASVCSGTTPIDSVKSFDHAGRLLLPLAEWVFKPALECPDIELHDGDLLDKHNLGAVVVHTPGHTPTVIDRKTVEKLVYRKNRGV